MTKDKNILNTFNLIELEKEGYSKLEIGLALCMIGNFNSASEFLLAHCHKNRSRKQSNKLDYLIPIKTNKARLLYDIEQFYFLKEKGLLNSTCECLIKAYLDVLASAPENSSEGEFFNVSKNAPKEFLENYNQLIYFDKPTTECKRAINPEIDWARIDLDFCENSKDFVVLDNFLTKEALNELYRFCLLSTVWEQINTVKDFYAILSNGLASPIIFQIAYEFRCALANLLAELYLFDGWAIKYCGKETEVGIHADRGKITLNFWITPDSANLIPGTGGLRIWNRHLPNTYFEQYEQEKKAFIEKALRAPDIKSTLVTYKCNRAIIFRSSLAHGTEPFMFSDNYSERRMNITLLFGKI
ncbi:MAG: hypothetical protein HY819_12990 [Acidobacteria bacterium]|nr:hypothetical protein [Acidobacteriota bacterium]